jgi:hypothetical protein
MNITHYAQRTLLIVLIVNSTILQAQPTVLAGSSFLSPRSQNINLARHMVGIQRFINMPDQCFHSYFSIIPQYTKSYRPYRITEYFFGETTLSVSGSQVTDRNPDNILADYFGLSPEFSSATTLQPYIQNTLLDFTGHIEYNRFYLSVFSPMVWSTTTITGTEIPELTGIDTPFPALYMDVGATDPVYFSFARALGGGLPFGQVQPLQFGKLTCAQKKWGFADVQIYAGHNWVQDDLGHLGISLLLIVPTGNRSCSEYLLEPICGNGHHVEIGFTIGGHWVVWEKDVDQYLAVYGQGNFSHLCNARQRRSFDFGYPNFIAPNLQFCSRYTLLKEFDEQGNYTGVTLPAINVTTLWAESNYAIQVDGALMLGYVSRWFNCEVGYNVWVRSHENLCLCEGIPDKKYGMKGIQNVAGPGINNTQSTATIFGNPFAEQAALADNPSPVFISTGDLNLQSAAAPTTFTQKLFWNFSWNHPWCNEWCTKSAPFIGFGGFLEFEGLNPRYAAMPNQIGVSQWAWWLKTGIAF